MSDDKKMFDPPSQKEANYLPAGGGINHACSNCRWFIRDGWDNEPDRCHLIANWPEPIVPNGVCDRHEVGAPETVVEITPIPVVIVEDDAYEAMEMSLKRLASNVSEAVLNVIKASPLQRMMKADSAPFEVFRTPEGKKYWIARHTGKFVDRHKEILADIAHDEYVASVGKGLVDPPELWTLHKRGTRHGVADVVWKSDGFTLALGHFDETPEAEKAFDYYRKNRGKIRLSHGFYYPKEAKINGVFYAYNTFEITTLHENEEAFPYTDFASFEEIEAMALSKQEQDRILAIGGEGMLRNALEADKQAGTKTKELEAQGVAYKGYENFEGRTIPADDTPILKDLATRLEAAEKVAESVDELKATLASLAGLPETVKSLIDQNKALTDSNNALLETVNAMNAKAEELNALKPPASKSEDTLLDSREKSIVEQVAKAAETESMPSLVKQMVEGQTTVSQV